MLPSAVLPSAPHALNKHGLTDAHLKVGVELFIHKHSSRAYEVPGGTKETQVLTSRSFQVQGEEVSEGARQGWCPWEAGLSWEDDSFKDERQSSLENTPGGSEQGFQANR